MRSLAQALHATEATAEGRLLVRALLALGALEEHPGLLRAVHEIDRAGPAARLATGLTLREVALLVDVLRVLRYVDEDRLTTTTLGRAVVALDHHQHEAELGDLSSAPPSGLGRLALVPDDQRDNEASREHGRACDLLYLDPPGFDPTTEGL